MTSFPTIKMAEAAVEGPLRFYCHQCSIRISPNLPDYTCPRCESGFIEEVAAVEMEESTNMDTSVGPDPAAQFAELWGRAFLDSFRMHTDPEDEAQQRDSDEPDQDMDNREREERERTAAAARQQRPRYYHLHRRRSGNRSDRHPAIETIIQQLLGGLAGGAVFQAGGIPMVNLYGNPGDYAWGSGGLDSIITQLLNQFEGTGPPPAEKEKINMLPTKTVTQSDIDKHLQCSICLENFVLDEKARELPCTHPYHSDCIVPWLELHGTCPICRKNLNGEDTTQMEEPNIFSQTSAAAAASEAAAASDNRSSQDSPSSSSSNSRENRSQSSQDNRAHDVFDFDHYD